VEIFNRPDLVAPETRDRVQCGIDRLGYVRSEAACPRTRWSRSRRTGWTSPPAEMGQIAAGLLVEEVTAGPGQHRHRRVVLEPELIVRESSRPDSALAGQRSVAARRF
jgi:DNA-binding LacI/PurR family transcriptional regulator